MEPTARIAAISAAFLLSAGPVSLAASYYSQSSGSPLVLVNWNSNPAGGGSTPGSFSAGDTFVIQDGHTMTATTAWTLSGSAKLQVNSGGTLAISGTRLNLGGDLINHGLVSNSSLGLSIITFTSSGFYSGTGIISAGTGGSSRFNWVIDAGATLTLGANLAYLNTGSIHRTFTVNGTLDCGNFTLTGGSGIDFILNAGGTLATARSNGINGSLVGFASTTLSTAGNYIFNGSSSQVTGTALPATVNSLMLANPAGLTLSGNVTVSGTMTLSGVLNLHSPATVPVNTGALDLVGPTTINLLSGDFVSGQTYPLILYTSFGGSGPLVLGAVPQGVAATLAASGDSIFLTGGTSPDPTDSSMDLGLTLLGTGDSKQLQFLPPKGFSYMIESSPDLISWTHRVTRRGPGIVQWSLPSADASAPRNFFRLGKVVAHGLSNLTGWAAYQASPSGSFRIGAIGDSYTANRDRYVKRLKQTLASTYGDLGAGFLGFSAWATFSSSVNGSSDETQLSCSVPAAQWTSVYGSGYGPDAGHVTAATSNSSLSVTVHKSVDSLKIYYAKTASSPGFRYGFQTGGITSSWTNVPTAAGATSLGTESLTVSSRAAPYTMEIQALGTGVALIGVEAVINGTGVVLHKLGSSGGRASGFTGSMPAASLRQLDLDMAIIMFGTNEQGGNVTPAAFKANLQSISNNLRTQNPAVDLVFMLPCYTANELESPRAYKLQDYGNAMRDVATANQGAFLDFTQIFGPAAELQNLIDSGLMHTDRIHPSTTGIGSGGFLMADTITWSILSMNAP